MEELKLEVGQKCWSIQLGDCVVVDKILMSKKNWYKCVDELGHDCFYSISGRESDFDFYQSLFISNPFDEEEKAKDIYSKAIKMLINNYPQIDKILMNKKGIPIIGGNTHFEDCVNYKIKLEGELGKSFENQSVNNNDMVTLEKVSEPENKADLIGVLLNGFSLHLADKYNNPDERITKINDLVYEKLEKLLNELK